MNKRKERNTDAFKNKHRKLCKSHYERNKQYYFERNVRLALKKRAWITEYKEARGCSKCFVKYRAHILDFHHTNPEEKRDNISSMISLGWSTIKAEVAKCIILCANCHREVEYCGVV